MLDQIKDTILAKDYDALANCLASIENVNARDKLGWAPIFYAVSLNDGIAAQMILAAGGDPKITDDSGLTPINYSDEKGNSRMSAILSENLSL